MKELIHKIARKFGLDIIRYNPTYSEIARLKAILNFYKIEIVLDVGANIGQYAKSLRDGGYKGKIISFEPLSSAHKQLTVASQYDSNWIIAPRVAIGKIEQESEINISENLCSSSLLPVLEECVKYEPKTHYIDKEKVRVVRLDQAALQYIENYHNIFLKIDTQGFEDDVLNGASGILPNIKGIQLELSLIPLYEGQLLFKEMMDKLIALGYELYALQSGFTDNQSGRLLQVDGIFIKRS